MCNSLPAFIGTARTVRQSKVAFKIRVGCRSRDVVSDERLFPAISPVGPLRILVPRHENGDAHLDDQVTLKQTWKAVSAGAAHLRILLMLQARSESNTVEVQQLWTPHRRGSCFNMSNKIAPGLALSSNVSYPWARRRTRATSHKGFVNLPLQSLQMEGFVEDGLAKSIGVSNFTKVLLNPERVKRILCFIYLIFRSMNLMHVFSSPALCFPMLAPILASTPIVGTRMLKQPIGYEQPFTGRASSCDGRRQDHAVGPASRGKRGVGTWLYRLKRVGWFRTCYELFTHLSLSILMGFKSLACSKMKCTISALFSYAMEAPVLVELLKHCPLFVSFRRTCRATMPTLQHSCLYPRGWDSSLCMVD